MGTLPYMAPEQALGKRDQIDGRTDIFALGAMSFRLLTGRRVHEADSEAQLLLAMATQPAPPLASVLPEVPRWPAMIVDMALAFTRDARYPDARTMQGDVRAARSGTPPPYASRVMSARDEATRAERPAAAPPPVSIPSAPASPPAPVSDPWAAAARRPQAAPAMVAPRAAPPGYAGSPRPVSAATPAENRRPMFLALVLVAALLLAVLLVGVGFAASRWTSVLPAGSASASSERKHEDKEREEERKREE
jgi:serine/threonine-protein kinase